MSHATETLIHNRTDLNCYKKKETKNNKTCFTTKCLNNKTIRNSETILCYEDNLAKCCKLKMVVLKIEHR